MAVAVLIDGSRSRLSRSLVALSLSLLTTPTLSPLHAKQAQPHRLHTAHPTGIAIRNTKIDVQRTTSQSQDDRQDKAFTVSDTRYSCLCKDCSLLARSRRFTVTRYSHRSSNPMPSRGSQKNESASKLQTDCSHEHAASLQCLADNLGSREACQTFFDNYKDCRKAENQRRLDANAQKTTWFS